MEKNAQWSRQSHVMRCLCHAEHKELVLLALDLLKRPPLKPSYEKELLFLHVYAWAKKSPEVRERLIQFLAQHGTMNEHFLFKQMQEDRFRFTDKELDVLGDSMQLPVRFFTYELVTKVDPERELPESLQKKVLEAQLEGLRKRLQAKPKP